MRIYNDYEIYKDGRVFSYKSNKFLKPKKKRKGYLFVCLTDTEGVLKYHHIHRLVAEAFIPNPNNLPEVDHIDADKTNNHVENLRWCSHKDQYKNEHTKKIVGKYNTCIYIKGYSLRSLSEIHKIPYCLVWKRFKQNKSFEDIIKPTRKWRRHVSN